MKRLLIVLLALSSLSSFAQVLGGTIGAQGYVSDRGKSLKLLPVSINITNFIQSSGVGDLDSLVLDDLKIALGNFSSYDIHDKGFKGTGKNLVMTLGGDMISFERKLFLFKDQQMNHHLLNFVDAQIGGVAELGDQFYLQINLHVSATIIKFGSSDSLYKISQEEFNEFVNRSDCTNCLANINSSSSYQSGTFGNYGLSLKARYKKFKLGLYNNNYRSSDNIQLEIPNPVGERALDYRELSKTSTVSEFKVEVIFSILMMIFNII